MFGAAPGYDAAAESAAFKRLHNVAAGIAAFRAQGNAPAVESLLPYYRSALDAYHDAGASDPAYLSQGERDYLATVQWLGTAAAAAGKVVEGVGSWALVAGALVVAGLYLWKK